MCIQNSIPNALPFFFLSIASIPYIQDCKVNCSPKRYLISLSNIEPSI